MTATSNDHKVGVAFYARVSGEEQTIGRNIEAQIDELKGLLPASYEIAHIYLDDGVSGATPLAERPEGSRLMADAAAGRFDKLMVTRIDRLCRSIVDLNQVAKTLYGLGIALRAQGLEFGDSPQGKFLLNSLGNMAEFERDLIKERTLSGKRFKAKALERWPGGTVPYGYAYTKGEPGEKGSWRVIEEEADVLRRIYRFCVENSFGLSAIADRLSDEGIPTPSAVRADPKHPRAKPNCLVAKRWGRSHVGKLLRNPSYMGSHIAAVDGEKADITPSQLVDLIRSGTCQDTGLIEIRVPEIVHESVWWTAQDKLDARRRLPNPHYETWPFQGRIACGADGHRFSCRRNGQKGRRVYSCTGREGHVVKDAPRCNAPRLDAEQLEAAVFWNLKGVLSSPKTGRKAVEEYLSRLEALQEEASRGLAPIQKRLDESTAEEDRLDELYLKGRYRSSPEKYERRLDEILNVRRTLEVEKSKRQREIDVFETRRREIGQIRAAIAEDRFNIRWSPSREKLRIALFREPDVVGEPFDFADGGEAEFRALQPRKKKPSKAAVGTHGRGSERFEAAAIEARFESEYDIRRLFELFDIKVVVHDDFVEVRGAFPKPMTIGLEEMGEVALFPSRAGTTHHGRPVDRSLSLSPRPKQEPPVRSSAGPEPWPPRTGRP